MKKSYKLKLNIVPKQGDRLLITDCLVAEQQCFIGKIGSVSYVSEICENSNYCSRKNRYYLPCGRAEVRILFKSIIISPNHSKMFEIKQKELRWCFVKVIKTLPVKFYEIIFAFLSFILPFIFIEVLS